MTLEIAALVISILGLFISPLLTYVAFVLKQNERITRLEARPTLDTKVDDATLRIVKLETKMAIFWKTVEETVPRQLIAPHSPERDELLRKMIAGNLTDNEADALLKDLECSLDKFPQDKKLAAILTITKLKLRLAGVD